MTPIAVATEDQLSEAIVLRLIAELKTPYHITFKLGKRGNGYLRTKMSSWRQMAEQHVMVVLTDLDRAECVVEFRDDWLQGANAERLVFRIAVREVESWVMADHEAMRALIGAKGSLPNQPDALPDPKRTFLQLAKGAPKSVRDDLLKVVNGQAAQGLGYNARLSNWVESAWSPQRAAERSPSLAKARMRLADAVKAFALQ